MNYGIVSLFFVFYLFRRLFCALYQNRPPDQTVIVIVDDLLESQMVKGIQGISP